MMLLLYKTYLVLFVDQYKPPRNWLKREQVLKISGSRKNRAPESHKARLVQNQNVIIAKTRLMFPIIAGWKC